MPAIALCVSLGVLLASAYTLLLRRVSSGCAGRVGQASMIGRWMVRQVERRIKQLLQSVAQRRSWRVWQFALDSGGRLSPVRSDCGKERQQQFIRIALGLVLATAVILAGGADTPVHYYFWRYFPLANSFRVPGRITLLLPPIFMFILAWFFRTADDRTPGRKVPIPLWIFVLLAIPIFITGQILLAGPGFSYFVPRNIQQLPAWVDPPTSLWSGLGCLVLAAIRVSRFPIPNSRRPAGFSSGDPGHCSTAIRHLDGAASTNSDSRTDESGEAVQSGLRIRRSWRGYAIKNCP